MKYNYKDLFNTIKPSSLKPTHCFELLLIANKAWKEKDIVIIDAHYLTEGLCAKVRDFDNQEYEVTIKPVKVK